MSTKITNLTGFQREALQLAADSYGLEVRLTRTTATFPQEPAMAELALRDANKAMRADGLDVSVTRPVAFVARKARAKNKGRALPAFTEAMKSVTE